MELISSLMIIVACLALSAFFSGSETALMRLREHEVEEEVDAKRGPAGIATRDLLSSTSRLLVTILFGNNVANILAASVASAAAVRAFGADVGIAASTAIMTLLVFVFCEILPKAVAANHPKVVANRVAVPLYLLHKALKPVHLFFDRFVDPMVKRTFGEADDGTAASTEELLRIARHTGMADQPAASPEAIIGAAAGAAEMTVFDIMVPRTEIVAFPVTIEPKKLLDELLEERYTRVPIFEDTIDHVVGVAHFKDLVQLVQDNGEDIRTILTDVIRVPERKPILRLLTDMQRRFTHIAIVKDEFGVTQGIVTQEDILEELVGEIRDEFDRDELSTIRKLGDHSYQVLGRIKVLDFNRETGWNIPAERGDTLAGLVFNELGHAPHKWETLRVPGYQIRVVDLSGSRITHVLVRESTSPTEQAAAS